MESRREVQVCFVPISGGGFKRWSSAARMCSMPLDKQPDWETTRNRAALLVSRMPSVSTFKTACTSTPEERRREGVKGACPGPFQRQSLSCNSSSVRLSDGTNKREDRQSINFEGDESLDKAGAHTNTLVSRVGPSVVTWVLTHSESCETAKFPFWIQ